MIADSLLLLYSILPIFLSMAFAYILADFLVGLNHWLKDTYFSPLTPVIGKHLIWGSRLHHIRPRHVIEFADTTLITDSAKWTLPWIAPLMIYTGPTPFMLTLATTLSCNDVIHKYSHMKDEERPRWASMLQKVGLFQSYSEHRIHHTMPHESHYCPVSPYVNSILEPLHFWRRLEWLIERVTSIKPRSAECDFIEDPTYAAGIRFLSCTEPKPDTEPRLDSTSTDIDTDTTSTEVVDEAKTIISDDAKAIDVSVGAEVTDADTEITDDAITLTVVTNGEVMDDADTLAVVADDGTSSTDAEVMGEVDAQVEITGGPIIEPVSPILIMPPSH